MLPVSWYTVAVPDPWLETQSGLPVEKDLVVNMEPFFDAYRAVKPFLITSGNPPTRERIQSQTDRARYDDTTKCILCACCTTSCPVYWSEGSYFGPAAIVNAHRFIFDSRGAIFIWRSISSGCPAT